MDGASFSPPNESENLQESKHAEPKQDDGPSDSVLEQASQKHVLLLDSVTVRIVPEGISRDSILKKADDTTDTEVDCQ